PISRKIPANTTQRSLFRTGIPWGAGCWSCGSMKSLPPRFQGRHDARSLALQALLDCDRHEGFVQEVLDRLLTQFPLPPADRRLAATLAYGVLRRRGTLLALLRPLVSRRPDQVEPWLRDTLLLGACQLVLLDHIPVHAALHETVELAARF